MCDNALHAGQITKAHTADQRILMNTTATYRIEVITDEGTVSFLRTMPTRPKTHKGVTHNTRLENYAKKQYPNWNSIDVKLLS